MDIYKLLKFCHLPVTRSINHLEHLHSSSKILMKLMYHYYVDQILEIFNCFANVIFIEQDEKLFVILLGFFVESFTIRKFKETKLNYLK